MPKIDWNVLEDFEELKGNLQEYDFEKTKYALLKGKMQDECVKFVKNLVKSSGLNTEDLQFNSIKELLEKFILDRLELIKQFSNKDDEGLISGFCREIEYAVKLQTMFFSLF